MIYKLSLFDIPSFLGGTLTQALLSEPEGEQLSLSYLIPLKEMKFFIFIYKKWSEQAGPMR